MPPRKRSPLPSNAALRPKETPNDLLDFVDFGADEDTDVRDLLPKRSRVKIRHPDCSVAAPTTRPLGDVERGLIDLDCDENEFESASFFSKAKAVPLTLQIRSLKESPPEIDAASHTRLMALLTEAGLRERRVRGDGNCQFRALADQLYGDEGFHSQFRRQAIQQMESCTEAYCGFVRGSFKRYLSRMRCEGTWGDHVTLQASADALGVEVHLLSDYLTDAYIKVVPRQHKSEKILKLCFWSEYHYNSVE